MALTIWRSRQVRAVAAFALASAIVAACGGSAKTPRPNPSGSTAIASPATGSPFPTSSPIADSPVGRRLTWVLDEMNGRASTLTAADVAGQFDPTFLAQVPATQLIPTLQQTTLGAPYTVRDYTPIGDGNSAQARFEATLATFKVSITVSAAEPNLIVGLLLQATSSATPTATWDQIDSALTGLAPEHSLYAGEIAATGCQPVHTLDASQPHAIGSAFKLYVLGELGREIGAGTASWTEQYAIRDEWKSLPSGKMQNDAAGTQHTLLDYAQQMISISDNTAADHLIHRLGRENVEANLPAMGMADPARNIPFLYTRDMFVLKATKNAALQQRYLAADAAGRRALLDSEVAASKLSLFDVVDWSSPRAIDTLEWFASTADLCSAMAYLHGLAAKPGLSQIQDILTINPAMNVDGSVWTYVGYKGGSEPGVLQLTWLLRRADNRWFVVSVTLDDPTSAADNTLAALCLGADAMSLLGVAK